MILVIDEINSDTQDIVHAVNMFTAGLMTKCRTSSDLLIYITFTRIFSDYSMKLVFDKIDSVAQNIINAENMFSLPVSKTVKEVLIAILKEKKTTVLVKKDVEQIADKLVEAINGNRRSIYVWLHHEFFNRLIVKLQNGDVIECPFIINNGRKRERDLIFFFDRQPLADIKLVTHVMNYLENFKDCEDTILSEDAILSSEQNMVCAYVASSILYSHIFFLSSYKSLLTLNKDDISFEHNFINITLTGKTVFYRCFLSFHSALRLYRLILFYSKESISNPGKYTDNDSSDIFRLSFPLEEFPDYFKDWLNEVVKKITGSTDPIEINLTSFIKAARCMSVLESFNKPITIQLFYPVFCTPLTLVVYIVILIRTIFLPI